MLAWAATADAEPGRPRGLKPKPAYAVTPGAKGSCEQPLWSRDGTAIAYARNFLKEKREFYVVRDFEAQDEVPVFPAGNRSAVAGFLRKKSGRACPSFAWGPTMSPSTFAFTCSDSGRFHLFWNGERFNGKHPPLERISDDKSVTVGEAAWGVNSWDLAWVSVGRDVPNGQIWTMRDQAAPTLLNPQPSFVQLGPVWSPDGQSLAYYAHEGEEGGADLFVVGDVAHPRRTARQLTRGAAIEKNPSWSPDGRRLAYFHIEQKKGRVHRQLRMIDVSGQSAPVVLAKNVRPNRGAGPAWTPDGRWIAYIEELKSGKRLNRLRIVEVEATTDKRRDFPLATKTALNEDVSLGVRDGKWMLAFTAVDENPRRNRRWRRVYVYSLEYFRQKRRGERGAKATKTKTTSKKSDSIFLPVEN